MPKQRTETSYLAGYKAGQQAGFEAGLQATWRAILDYLESDTPADQAAPAKATARLKPRRYRPARPIEAPPQIIARPNICEDEIDTENYGRVQGVEYVAGDDREGYETSIYVPAAPTGNPHDVPYIGFLGHWGWPVEDFIYVYDQIGALLNSPEVLEARRRFARQKAEQLRKNRQS